MLFPAAVTQRFQTKKALLMNNEIRRIVLFAAIVFTQKALLMTTDHEYLLNVTTEDCHLSSLRFFHDRPKITKYVDSHF